MVSHLDTVDGAELDVETIVGIDVGVALHAVATAPSPAGSPCDIVTARRGDSSA